MLITPHNSYMYAPNQEVRNVIYGSNPRKRKKYVNYLHLSYDAWMVSVFTTPRQTEHCEELYKLI
jgi:hypothetical protein